MTVVSIDCSNRLPKRAILTSFIARKRRVWPPLAKRRLRNNASLFRKIERQYGVQKEVLVTIWGMETGFGGYTGKLDIVNSLASLTP